MSPIYGQYRTKWPRENPSLRPAPAARTCPCILEAWCHLAQTWVIFTGLTATCIFARMECIKVPRGPSLRLDQVMLFTSLIELAFTFAKSYSQFIIKIHSGRPHGVKFAKIFGNNAWPQLIPSWLDHQPSRYLLFPPDWLGWDLSPCHPLSLQPLFAA